MALRHLGLFFLIGISNFCFALPNGARLSAPQPNIDKVEIDLNEMAYYLMYAYTAYCENSSIINWDCYYCKSDSVSQVQTVGDWENIFGFAGTTANFNIFSFRGTQPSSIKNWIEDIDTIRVDYPYCSGCQVHQGFYNSYLSVQSQVLPIVKRLSANGKPWIITGHSLGAALAVHCAADINQQVSGSQPTMLIDFGQPRVGNANFAKWFESRVPNRLRVVNQRDIVPHLPPKAFGFHHISTEYWFPKNVTYFRKCNGSGEDPSCSDSVLGDSVLDHISYLGYSLIIGELHGC